MQKLDLNVVIFSFIATLVGYTYIISTINHNERLMEIQSCMKDFRYDDVEQGQKVYNYCASQK